ncbi:MAG: tRNA 2-selenouridine(34) synthase MnmH [Pseudomonadaceae bacterium]|nr:tRNA 2-selenouridine(34) synthase MnmH [Pseudomonadaceae bacterium]
MQPSSKKHPEHDELIHLLADQRPFLDVRAPAEFTKGHLPNSFNLPILNDDERHQVGLAYRTEGQLVATRLGHKLVSGEVKKARVNQWQTYIDSHPDACVMCWRGGQRSQIAQQWLAESGYVVSRVSGGYKAARQACLDILQEAALSQKPWFILAGRTGVQKTVLLNTLNNSIDLEGLANHRGSAFGARSSPQPSLPSFENNLAAHYLRHTHPSLILEDESRMIGRIAVPESWHLRMKKSPLVLLEATLEERVEHIVNEYVDTRLSQGDSTSRLQAHYRSALKRIARRLGGLAYQQIDDMICRAFEHQADHHQWVRTLLRDYYDPMYDYQLEGKASRVIYTGTFPQVQAFLRAQSN